MKNHRIRWTMWAVLIGTAMAAQATVVHAGPGRGGKGGGTGGRGASPRGALGGKSSLGHSLKTKGFSGGQSRSISTKRFATGNATKLGLQRAYGHQSTGSSNLSKKIRTFKSATQSGTLPGSNVRHHQKLPAGNLATQHLNKSHVHLRSARTAAGFCHPRIRIGAKLHAGAACIARVHWCHARPIHCHWWYDFCAPIRYCQPVHCTTYAYHYVTCDAHLAGGTIVRDVRWYLGLTGTLLPGKGIGIDGVDEGSPAALAGLAPGMVIVNCNGRGLLAEGDFPTAIEQSGGLLQLSVVDGLDAPPRLIQVRMQQLVTAGY